MSNARSGKTWLYLAAVLGIFALLTVGCGSDDGDDDVAEPADVSAGEPADEPASEPADDSDNEPAEEPASEPAEDTDEGPMNMEPVRLGFMTPLSAQFASIGQSYVEALELYLDQNDNMLGGREVELFTVDEGAGAAEALPGARQLIQQDDVDVVTGIVSSATGAAVFPEFEQAEIPVLISQGYPYSAPEPQASPYLWAPGSANPPFTISMGEFMASAMGDGESVYFIAPDYVRGQSLLNDTMAAFEAAGGIVAGTALSPLGDTLDYQPYLTDILQSDAAAVWAFYAGSDALRFTEQYDTFGLRGELPLFSTSSLIAGENLSELGASAEGVTTNTYYDSGLENPENLAFVEAYQAKYGRTPDNFALQQYDNMLLLDLALASVEGEITSEAIIAGLQAIGTLSTPRGEWSIDPDSHLPLHNMYMFRVNEVDGEYVNVLHEDLGVYHPVTGEKVG